MAGRSAPSQSDGRASRSRARELFLTGEDCDLRGVRDPIRQSWQRSRDLTVAPDRPEPSFSSLDLDAPFIQAAEPIIRELGDRLEGQKISVILTDVDGLILIRRTGDAAFERRLDRVAVTPGFSLAERFVGTNGVGTALAGDTPIGVFGTEHYAEPYSDLACVGVPLHDPVTGEILGLLDVTCPNRHAGPLLSAMASMAAGEIRQAVLASTSRADRDLISLRTSDPAKLRMLVASERRQRELAETIQNITAAAASTLNARKILRRVMSAAAHMLAFDTVWALAREPSGTLRVVAVHGDVDSRALGQTIRPRPGSPILDAYTGRGLADPGRGPPGPLPGQRHPIGSWLAVPAAFRPHPTVLILITCRAAGCYGPDQLAIARAVLGHAAVACENACRYEEAQRLARMDPLTGLANRRHLLDRAEAMTRRHLRSGRPMAVLMADIDHFKRVNDLHGHATGDTVLTEVAQRFRATLRARDLIGRIGGEEFAAVLDAPAETACAFAERLRETVSVTPIPTSVGPLSVTVSVGLATLNPADTGLDSLLAAADTALYHAKNTGRNRAVVADALLDGDRWRN
ncbi:diguanylate cyclase [Frankia sp. Mgl5]|uniref:diguanylate cyclase n=1 Tax=Frankia sp. Mgl5 TaxID=2933793 RepID=UPI00200F632A|nr:diguanylate cyclase [Frankia sp. Mgl5]MCK9929887.1 diguanylate cyclase [Frankia sp. Mgl5]